MDGYLLSMINPKSGGASPLQLPPSPLLSPSSLDVVGSK